MLLPRFGMSLILRESRICAILTQLATATLRVLITKNTNRDLSVGGNDQRMWTDKCSYPTTAGTEGYFDFACFARPKTVPGQR
jgi:hypothetical protein